MHHDDKALRQTVASMVQSFHERSQEATRRRLRQAQLVSERARGRKRVTLPRVSILALPD